MAQAAVRPGVDQSLDVHRKRFSQVAFDLILLIDDLADLDDLIFTQILHADRTIDPGLVQNVAGRRPADPEYIGDADIRPLLSGDIRSGDTCHTASPRRTSVVDRQSRHTVSSKVPCD